MKKYTFLLFLFFTISGHTQLVIYEYCFDQTGNCANYTMSDPEPVLKIDTVFNPNNVWQIGPPQKTVFINSFSSPNVIITDTISTYPTNDTSRFTIENTTIQASSSVNWSNFRLYFKYFVDSDTISDFGLIEFSPDNGTTWIDLINDMSYESYLEWSLNGNVGVKPTLTGSSVTWMEASVNMRDLGVLLDIQPGTTFMWRFSFISDAIQNNRDGLMYDDIVIEITPPIGLNEMHIEVEKTLVKVVDLQGREVNNRTNTPLIYIYSDGTSEKVFRIE